MTIQDEQSLNNTQIPQPGIYDVGEIIFNIEYRNLKTEFLEIINDYIEKPITMITMEEMSNRYNNLFNHFDLRDLQWRLKRAENSVIFTPIREIDKLAINGILAL